jgi:Sigma-70, region 4
MRPTFQVDDDDGATLDAISMEIGVSRERVRQIEAVALRKVRAAMAIRDQLGAQRAHAIWDELRGRPVGDFERALREAREATCST